MISTRLYIYINVSKLEQRQVMMPIRFLWSFEQRYFQAKNIAKCSVVEQQEIPVNSLTRPHITSRYAVSLAVFLHFSNY